MVCVCSGMGGVCAVKWVVCVQWDGWCVGGGMGGVCVVGWVVCVCSGMCVCGGMDGCVCSGMCGVCSGWCVQ